MKGVEYKFNTSSTSVGSACFVAYCKADGTLTKSFSIMVQNNTCTFESDRNGYFCFTMAEDAWCPWKSVRFAVKDVYDGVAYGKLTGKTILYNGDSITESRFGGWNDNGGAYPEMIAQKTGGHYTNYALSNATLANRAGAVHVVASDIVNMDAYADAVVISAGVNDYWYSIPLGTYNANDYTGAVNINTVTGALEQIFRDCINKWVGAAILFVIEHKITTTNTPNSAGYTFDDMRKRIIEICNKYSIPYVDMYAEGGLNGYMASLNAAFLNGGSGTHPDGCHPDAKGYETYYVPRVLAKLEEIMK